MDEARESYRVFLLRLWRDAAGEPGTWRCSLQDPGTKQKRGFDSLESLTHYLQGLISDVTGPNDANDNGRPGGALGGCRG